MKKWMEIVLIVLISTACGAAGGWIFGQDKKGEDFPIAVLNVVEIVEMTVKENPEEKDPVSLGVWRAEQIAKQLSEEGFVVLGSTSVMAAPAQYMIPRIAEGP